MQYKPLTLSPAEQRIVDTLKLHARDMFPTAHPAGHDWQHIDSQMTLWQHVGGSVLKEPQFAEKVDYFVPFLVSACHDVNRLPFAEEKGRPLKKRTEDLTDKALEEALTHNAAIDAYNKRALLRNLGFCEGFLRRLVSFDLRARTMAVLEYPGGKNKSDDPPEFIVCNDLDKAITGQFYAWRCAAVGAGQRIKHVVKNYLFATPPAEERWRVVDEGLESWVDDLRWARDWDPCNGKSGFEIRSAVLHEIADPGFRQLERLEAEAIGQLRSIGYTNYR